MNDTGEPSQTRRDGAALRASVLFVLGGACVIYAGCMSTEAMAPPVGTEFTAVAQNRNVSLSTLEVGRQVYLVDCSRCHSIEPIARYSKDRWNRILPRMIKESKLNGERGNALTAYVFSAHDVLATRASAGGGR